MNRPYRNPSTNPHLDSADLTIHRPTVIPAPRTPERLFNGWGVRL